MIGHCQLSCSLLGLLCCLCVSACVCYFVYICVHKCTPLKYSTTSYLKESNFSGPVGVRAYVCVCRRCRCKEVCVCVWRVVLDGVSEVIVSRVCVCVCVWVSLWVSVSLCLHLCVFVCVCVCVCVCV